VLPSAELHNSPLLLGQHLGLRVSADLCCCSDVFQASNVQAAGAPGVPGRTNSARSATRIGGLTERRLSSNSAALYWL
jgi:hypothetical protein